MKKYDDKATKFDSDTKYEDNLTFMFYEEAFKKL